MSKDKLYDKLIQIESKYEELTQQLSSPEVHSDSARYQKLAKTHAELSAVGQNLLQPSHVEFGGDPGPLVGIKRGEYVRLVWKK